MLVLPTQVVEPLQRLGIGAELGGGLDAAVSTNGAQREILTAHQRG